MSVTFDVDRVDPATEPIPDAPLPEVFNKVAGRTLVTCTDADLSLLRSTSVHPLAAAVHHAFTDHRPLILSPDVVWLTIAQGFAQHVNANAETLRYRLVQHEGVRTLTHPVLGFETHQDWADAIDGLCELVTAEVEPGVGDLMRCDFSTTTPVTRVAGDVVLLDTFQRYFQYEFTIICGIPEVTLLGTVDDWRKIEQRVQTLTKYDLGWWADLLHPVCRELRRTVEGKPDLDFWQSIYMPEEVYGGRKVTGWIVRFFPYLESPSEDQLSERFERAPSPQRSVSRKNYGLDKWPPTVNRSFLGRQRPTPVKSRNRWLCAGVSLKELPLGLSRVPVRITDSAGDLTHEVQLIAGFVGVTQTDALALRPHIGWGVVQGIDELSRIERF